MCCKTTSKYQKSLKSEVIHDISNFSSISYVILYSEAYRTRVLQESGSAEPGMMRSDIEIKGPWNSVVNTAIYNFDTIP